MNGKIPEKRQDMQIKEPDNCISKRMNIQIDIFIVVTILMERLNNNKKVKENESYFMYLKNNNMDII